MVDMSEFDRQILLSVIEITPHDYVLVRNEEKKVAAIHITKQSKDNKVFIGFNPISPKVSFVTNKYDVCWRGRRDLIGVVLTR